MSAISLQLIAHQIQDGLPQYFVYHGEAIANIQKVVDLVIVDVGGRSHGVQLPVVKNCSHYLELVSHRWR